MITVEKEQTNIKTKAEFIITLTWADKNINDVDIWLEDPLGKRLFYRKKEVGLMHLDRDDQGVFNDTITLSDGTQIKYDHNQEIATIRGFISGEWTLNVHMYHLQDGQPTPIEIKMDKLNPYETIIYEKIIMKRDWEQITVSRFTMTERGVIISMDKLPKDLINTQKLERPYSRNPSRGISTW